MSFLEQRNPKWKPVKGYEGIYEVSYNGRVRSYHSRNGVGLKKTPHILRQGTTPQGYKTVVLNKDTERSTKRVHRLVAEAFIYNKNKKETVNHIDGDKSNNRADNLEWSTQAENNQHAYDIGLKVGMSGKSHWNSRLTENDVIDIRNAYRLGCFSYNDIAKAYEITKGMVGHIINKRSWTHI